MKPIETEYKGYRFRSRLEARWAIFFDACGVDWEYEPEGYDLGDGLYYLPDFLLHGVDGRDGGDLYVEVKGQMTDLDALKINRFAEQGGKVLVVGKIAVNFFMVCTSLVSVFDFQDTVVAGVDRRDAFHHQVEVNVAGNCAVEDRDGFVAAKVLQDANGCIEVEFRVVEQFMDVHSVALLDFKAVPAG